MFSVKLDPYISLIDLKPGDLSHFIASYVIKAEKVAIVETGPTATVPNMLAGLQELGVNVKDVDYVTVSHIHLDHGGGAGTLLSHLPRAKLIVHRRGALHVMRPEKLWTQASQVLGEIAELYEKPFPVAEKRIILAEDGMTFDLGKDVELKVIETLGHASHHQSYYEKKSRGIFPGDTAGVYIPKYDVIVPTTPAPFHLETTLASIEKLKSLKPSLLYYSHFGRATNAVEKLQSYADQLRLWAKIIAEKTKEGANMEEIKREIAEHDPALHKAADYIKTHLILNRGTIPQSIQGFKEYFKNLEKQGTKQF